MLEAQTSVRGVGAVVTVTEEQVVVPVLPFLSVTVTI